MVNPAGELSVQGAPRDSQKEEKEESKVEGAASGALQKERPVQKKRDRCWTCRKKLGLVGIECRCGYVFCSIHRYPEEHNCDFDYRSHHQQILEENNPSVVADKIKKI